MKLCTYVTQDVTYQMPPSYPYYITYLPYYVQNHNSYNVEMANT